MRTRDSATASSGSRVRFLFVGVAVVAVVVDRVAHALRRRDGVRFDSPGSG